MSLKTRAARVLHNGAEICEVTKILSEAKKIFGISANLLLYAVAKRRHKCNKRCNLRSVVPQCRSAAKALRDNGFGLGEGGDFYHKTSYEAPKFKVSKN
jgi:hypothetical protein